MSHALTPLVSALERAAYLIEAGAKPAQALRQVVRELTAYETDHSGTGIPPHPFKLGEERRIERVI